MDLPLHIAILLGFLQGITEWLPVSSEGMIVLTFTHLIHTGYTLSSIIEYALALHLGTVLAAIIFYNKDLARLTKTVTSYTTSSKEDKHIIKFYILATFISICLAGLLYKSIIFTQDTISPHLSNITAAIGIGLIITGYLQHISQAKGEKKLSLLRTKDALIVGIAQGCAALPGLSRSGLTTSALLLRKVEKQSALSASFILSIPIVILGNIVLNIRNIHFSSTLLIAILTSFVTGLITIKVFLYIARVVRFSYFMVGFGILTLVSSFI